MLPLWPCYGQAFGAVAQDARSVLEPGQRPRNRGPEFAS